MLVLCHEFVGEAVCLEVNASAAGSHWVVDEAYGFGHRLLELELGDDARTLRVEPRVHARRLVPADRVVVHVHVTHASQHVGDILVHLCES